MKPLIRAQISIAALQANLARIRRQAPGRRVMAVVKADAYGHGIVPVARALAGADALAVARLDEALALREGGVDGAIVLLEGVIDGAGLALAAYHRVQLVIHDAAQIALLEAAPRGAALDVWLKVDTGMNRLGFRLEDAVSALARLQQLGNRLATVRLLTHFASADVRGAAQTDLQLARFAGFARDRALETSLANSAAIFTLPESHGDWVRPGLALYGVSPFADEEGAALGLVPAMRLVSTVIATRTVNAGEFVGYGGTWRAARDSRIATIAAGYADGLPWSLPSGTPVCVAGQLQPLVGRVSMDKVTIDVTGAAVAIGDEVELWGPALPVERQAAAARTIPWELLCAVSQRVERDYR